MSVFCKTYIPASYLMSYLHKCKNTEAVFTSDYINILHTICSPTDCFRWHQLSLNYLDNSPVSSCNLHLLLCSSKEQLCKWKGEACYFLQSYTSTCSKGSARRFWLPFIGCDPCDFSNFWWKPITCVSALREIHQSLQCKIFQYTFHRQYPMKFQDFFLLCNIYQLVWLQLDYRQLGLWETRLLRPLCHKTEKTRFHVLYTDLKKMY